MACDREWDWAAIAIFTDVDQDVKAFLKSVDDVTVHNVFAHHVGCRDVLAVPAHKSSGYWCGYKKYRGYYLYYIHPEVVTKLKDACEDIDLHCIDRRLVFQRYCRDLLVSYCRYHMIKQKQN